MSHQTDKREYEQATPEEIRVRRWRRSQFMSLGFSLREAQLLTVEPVDLGQMRKLISSGCPPQTARRILA
jgi:hypothetical protein